MSKSSLLLLALLLLTCSALLSACDDTAQDKHPQKLLTKRVAAFKQMTKALAPLGQVARGREAYSRTLFVEQAREFKELSNQPWEFFTPDSNYPPTRAKPEVWSQPAKFKQAQQNYLDSVDKLVNISPSGNLSVINLAVTEVENRCRSCHQQFRNR